MCDATLMSKFAAPRFHIYVMPTHIQQLKQPLQLFISKGTLLKKKPLGQSYKERWMHCSSLLSFVTDEDWFSLPAMHLSYGTNPFPHASGPTLTFSRDMADVSLGVMWPRSSNLPPPLRLFRGIGLHASIVGEEGLHGSVTKSVIPKSLKVWLEDSSVVSSFMQRLSSVGSLNF